ncbi:MAG: hypothetical protein ABIL25_04220 [candidate division WOR-3 bacterium]
MRVKTLLVVCVVGGAAFATRMWTEQEFELFRRSYRQEWFARPESLIFGPRRYNYLERIKLACDFVAAYQVSDSGSPDFGGIIEAEHLPNVIETDNTQEAIWIWSRWYELTGSDDYRENIRRAWVYVLRHPAFWEHSGQPANVWYAIWNSGLALMVEMQYRRTYADSSFLSYADSCRGFLIRNPLANGTYLECFVTAQSSGMAYDFALDRSDQILRDTAVTRGRRIQRWLEDNTTLKLSRAEWAMCGGTAFWGVCNTVCREDTTAGWQWVQTYAESLPGFYPSGTWNCSHNIWLANAYRAAAELAGDEDWWLMHHYLTDTLLQKDTDRDGGIPATWTDPTTQDQTWVTTYLVFMGMDVFVTPTYDHDVAALEFASPRPRQLYITGDTIPVRPVVANVGLLAKTFPLTVRGPGYQHIENYANFPFLGIDTSLAFPAFAANSAGIYQLDAVTGATPDRNRLNDTSRVRFKVYGRFTLAGTLIDSGTGEPVNAWLKARISGASHPLDSAKTDSVGRFALAVIDTLIRIELQPGFPYYRRSWELFVHGDTTVRLETQTAHLLVVNNDTLEQYEGYYTSTLETLGITCHTWRRPSSGLPPYQDVDRLRSRTLIWYSGNTRVGTVPVEDQDSISALIARGASVLLTGQNIAEELAGTQFLEGVCGVRFDSSGWSRFFVFGNRADSLGSLIHATATAGGDGASNQTSRDMLSPMRNGAAILLVYDTLTNLGAAIRRLDSMSGARIITLGFGFESVNRPLSKPDFLTRVQLMSILLGWLCPGSGLAEPSDRLPSPGLSFFVSPNPFHSACNITALQHADIEIFSASGRRVAILPQGTTKWRPGPDIADGIYYLYASSGPSAHTIPVVLARH